MKNRLEKGRMSAVNDIIPFSVNMNTKLLVATMHSGLYASFNDAGNVSFFLYRLINIYTFSPGFTIDHILGGLKNKKAAQIEKSEPLFFNASTDYSARIINLFLRFSITPPLMSKKSSLFSASLTLTFPAFSKAMIGA